MLLLLLLLLTDATATATAPAAASATATAAASGHSFFFHKERKTGGAMQNRLEDRWLLHDETTTSIYENSAGF